MECEKPAKKQATSLSVSEKQPDSGSCKDCGPKESVHPPKMLKDPKFVQEKKDSCNQENGSE